MAKISYGQIKKEANQVVKELLAAAQLQKGDILVIGCSSSEIKGSHIGKGSDIDAAKAVYDGVAPVLKRRGIHLAAQCCEHLNRAIVIHREALPAGAVVCNAVPQVHAGGSFATTVYSKLSDPVVIEEIQGDAGIDIGDTLIGMHLKQVAVPVRTETKKIGEANVVCARTRPKYIGGSRAVYDDNLL